jgi:RNA polymerase sigma-70 factor (ECF subfamily)
MVDWDALLDEYGPMVFRISWRILGHAADVEDNVQEVFLEAYRTQQRQPVRHWRGLLRRLAVLGALGRLRRRRGDIPLGEISPADPGASPEQIAIGHEAQAKLRGAIASLPEREGAVFSLRYFEDLSLEEIAESLRIKYSAAATALSRARSKLESVFSKTPAEN